MAQGKKTEQLLNQKTLLNKQKIRIRKQIVKLDRLIANTDPESPIFTRYSEEKEALVIQLYSKEVVYEQVINTIQQDVKQAQKDIRKLIKEKRAKGFFDPGDPRLVKDLKRVWENAKDAVNIAKKYRNLKQKIHDDIYDKLEGFFESWETFKDSYKYRFMHASVKGVIKLGLMPFKIATKALLTKKVNQKSILGLKYGGQRVGRFKFSNNNLLRKYSSDYQDLGDKFYLMGNSLYNRDIRKGQVDAGDIIAYLKERGKTSEEIMDQLREFSKYGIKVSNTYQQLLNPEPAKEQNEDENEEFETIFSGTETPVLNYNPDNIDYQNKAVFIDEENKEALKDALIAFYDHIEDEKNAKRKKNRSLLDNIGELLKGTWNFVKGIFSTLFKWLGISALISGKFGLWGLILSALIGAGFLCWHFMGDQAKFWIKHQFSKIWDFITGKETKAVDVPDKVDIKYNSVEEDMQPIPLKEDFEATLEGSNIPEYDVNGKKLNTEVREAIAAASNETGLDPYEMSALFQTESNFNPAAVSSAGAAGIGQFMPGTWNDWGEGGNIYDVKDNAKASARYFKYLKDRYNGDSAKALAAYNWGMGNVDLAVKTYGEDLWAEGAATQGITTKEGKRKYMPDETQKYLKRNFNNRWKLLQVNGLLDKYNEKEEESEEDEDTSYEIDLGISLDDLENDKEVKSSLSELESEVNSGINENAILNDGVSPDLAINEKIIAEEEQKMIAEQKKVEMEEKEMEASGPEPIEIPSHIGGGGLAGVNSAAR